MKYSISINHDFETIDDLAQYFGRVMQEVESHHDELKDLDSSILGEDFDIEVAVD